MEIENLLILLGDVSLSLKKLKYIEKKLLKKYINGKNLLCIERVGENMISL